MENKYNFQNLFYTFQLYQQVIFRWICWIIYWLHRYSSAYSFDEASKLVQNDISKIESISSREWRVANYATDRNLHVFLEKNGWEFKAAT